jgi:hypothetical protein
LHLSAPAIQRCVVGAVVAVAALVLYVASLEHGVGYSDVAEFQTVPYILGIPHPTGFPGFVLLGWLWSHAVSLGDVATRMNVLSAISLAATAAVVSQLALELGAPALVAIACALAFATARAPWTHATHVEAHSVGLALAAGALLFALRYSSNHRPRDAVRAIVVASVAIAVDNTTILALTGVAILLVAGASRYGMPRRFVPALAVGMLIVVAAYAYLPIRSAIVTREGLDPTLGIGMPPGNAFWDDRHPSTLSGFVAEVTGKDFSPDQAVAGAFRPKTFEDIGQYYLPSLVRDFTLPFLILAFAGAILLAWRAPTHLVGLLAAAAIPLLFVFAYPEGDRVRYELVSYVVIAAMPAPAARAIALRMRRRWASNLLGIALLAVASLNLVGNADLFARRKDEANFMIGRVRAFTPDGAVVLAPWDYATALAYASYVERRLGGRVVVVTGTPEYVEPYIRGWLATRRVVVLTDQWFDARGLRVRRLDPFVKPTIVELLAR